MVKKVLIVVVGIAFLGAAFFGGTLVGKPGTLTGGRTGGPMGQLSAAEQAQVQNMTDAERQAYFQEKMGSNATNGPVGPRGAGGGLVSGEVIEVADDTIIVKVGTNSQTVYIDDATVIGYAEGASKVAVGSSILVFSQPSADNVLTAQAILVK